MRIFITYVGLQDPWGRPDPSSGRPTEGPILSILDHLHRQGKLPDRVILLITQTHRHKVPLQDGTEGEYEQEGMEEQAQAVKGEIEKLYDSITVDVRELAVNPADLDGVIEALQQALKGMDKGEEVHVNLTSGTPAMSAALAFLVDSGYLPYEKLWQSFDPTKLPQGAVRVQEVNLNYLAEQDRLERTVGLLKAMAFRSAAQGFQEIADRSLIHDRRPKARALVPLMEAYQLWDQAEFQKALKRLKQARNALQGVNLWTELPHLQDQLQTLQWIYNDWQSGRNRYGRPRETETILEDIYGAITRRHCMRNYINVATKARRLYEGILNYLIYEAGLNPKKARQEQRLETFNEDTQKRLRRIWPPRGDLDLRDKARIAEVLVNSGRSRIHKAQFEAIKREYQRFNGARNESYDEHGLGAVSSHQGSQARRAAANMLHTLLNKSVGKLEAYPFGAQALEELAEAIRETI